MKKANEVDELFAAVLTQGFSVQFGQVDFAQLWTVSCFELPMRWLCSVPGDSHLTSLA